MLGLSLAAGCLPIPQRLADMPEMSGRVTRGGAPAAGVEIAFALAREDRGCAEGRTTVTDSAGLFFFPATYERLPFTSLAPPSGSGRWIVCARTPAGEWAGIYTNSGYRGTTERIDCALAADGTGTCRNPQEEARRARIDSVPASADPAILPD